MAVKSIRRHFRLIEYDAENQCRLASDADLSDATTWTWEAIWLPDCVHEAI